MLKSSSDLFSKIFLFSILFIIVFLSTLRKKIKSIFWFELSNNESKFLAWLNDLGYPSNINLSFFWGSNTIFFMSLLTTSSVAKSPLEIISSISLPISDLFLISVLSRSPVDTWWRLNFLQYFELEFLFLHLVVQKLQHSLLIIFQILFS